MTRVLIDVNLVLDVLADPEPFVDASAAVLGEIEAGNLHVSRGPAPAAASRFVHRPRRPTTTPLYAVVQHHLETFLATAEDEDPRGWGVPSWVERDFRAYLQCDILAHGFARIRSDSCGHERLLAFSCKGRGVGPSCNTRRMAEVAAHLTDRVLPSLPVRQWVLSVTKRLRPYLNGDP